MAEKLYIQNKKGSRHYFRNFPLRDEIKQLLLWKNFTKPTPVQAEACEILLEEGLVDLCLIIYCFNGSGKTLSFLIPVLNTVNYMIPCQTFRMNVTTKREQMLPQPQALIVVPTETLMDQIYTYLTEYSDYLNSTFGWNLKIGRIFKDVFEPGHIVVGLTQMMSKRMNDIKYFMTELKWVVFDQCDDIKENSETYFTPLLKKLSESSNANFIVCSATGSSNPNEQDNDYQPNIQFRTYIQTHLPSKNVVELDIIAMLRQENSDTALTGVSHYYKSADNKDQVIMDILELFANKTVKNQMIIFFNSKSELANFYHLIRKENERFSVNNSSAFKGNLMVGYIHGSCGCSNPNPMHVHNDDCLLSKSERIKRLRNRQYNVMLATDAIGRGIDIRTVTMVINYSEPRNKTSISDVNYIHRAGRTGRYTDTGVALTFVTSMDLVNMVSKNQKVTFSELPSPKDIVAESERCYLHNEKAEREQMLANK